MARNIITRLMICLTVLGFSIYSYIDKQNQCTQLKMRLPKLAKELDTLRQMNAAYQYQIECFENPQTLLALSQQKEYAHLKYPLKGETLTLKAVAFQLPQIESHKISKPDPLIIAAKKS